VEVHEITFETDEALLLCSDGLTDLVDSESILRIVSGCPGNAWAVARALVEEANRAGGKDNVTVVYVEGENFRALRNVSPARPTPLVVPVVKPDGRRGLGWAAAIFVMLIVLGLLAYRAFAMPWLPADAAAEVRPLARASEVVQNGESIAAALSRARPGAEVVVEPGEYQERLILTNNIRLVSRVSRTAIIRLPATTSDAEPEPAVTVTGSSAGELVGFKIVGDARTPLGIGVLVAGTGASLVDVEVSGAGTAAVTFASDSAATMVGSDIHDNPGAALDIHAGAAPRITHSVFGRNGLSPRAPGSIAIAKGATAVVHKNVFLGLRPDVFTSADEASRLMLKSENWFLPHPARPSSHRASPASPGSPQRRP
jgi:hypothetical protein